MDTSHDNRTVRCRRLGHEVTFAYCRQEQDGQRPCRFIQDCWWQIFDVQDFLRKNLPAEEFALFQAGASAPSKVVGLFEMIEQARARLQSSQDATAAPQSEETDTPPAGDHLRNSEQIGNVVDVTCRLSETSTIRPKSLEALTARVIDAALDALQSSPAEVSVLYVEDPEMTKLNARYRNRTGATDVLSFSLREGPEPAPPGAEHLLGDIVISVDMACCQAAEAGHGPRREIAVLLIHGLLHLLGHDHEQGDEEALAMEDLQDQCLRAVASREPDLLV